MTSAELLDTARSIAATQLDDGMIPWYEGGHADPWNHVEAAMALSAAGLFAEAARAYRWLEARQRPDGSWHTYYLAGGAIEEPRLDTNVAAYVATGVWQHYLATGDASFLEHARPMVDAAVAFALGARFPTGEIAWSLDPDGSRGHFALVAASSSIWASLRAADAIALELARLGGELAVAGAVGASQAEVCRARERLGARLRRTAAGGAPGRFVHKDEYAMDWYYPVLAGVLEATAAAERLRSRAEAFVVPGWGVRCQSHRQWVTAAETAECAIAYVRAGLPGEAASLLSWLERHRQGDGSYLTGLVWPNGNGFPAGETSTYSAAAVVLAHDVLAGGPTAAAFAIASEPALGELPGALSPGCAAAPAGSR